MSRKINPWVWVEVTAGLSLMVGCGVAPGNRTVAMAGGARVTESQLNAAVGANQVLQGVHLDRTPAAVKSQVLTLAEQQVIINWALNHRVTTRAQAKLQAQTLIKKKLQPSLGGAAPMQKRLADNNLSMGAFNQYVQNQEILQDAFNRVTAHVSAPALADQKHYYLNNQAFFVSPPKVLLRDITVPTESQARSILTQLQGGANFSALAVRDSRDSYKSQGGSRGWLQLGASSGLPETWLNAIALLKPGQMSIVKGPLGYSIIEVQASRAGATIPFQSVQPAIQAELVQSAKQKMFDSWAANLMKTKKVRLFNIG